MCGMCLESLSQYAKNILVFTTKQKDVSNFIKKYFPHIEVVYGDVLKGYTFNVGFKVYNLVNLKEPFITLDADTYVFENIQPMIDTLYDKPWASVPWNPIVNMGKLKRTLPIKTVLIGGTHLCSDPDFLSWNKIKPYTHNTGEAGSFTAYFYHTYQQTKYDYLSTLDATWNLSDGFFDKTEMINNKWKLNTNAQKRPVNIGHYHNDVWKKDINFFNYHLQKYT